MNGCVHPIFILQLHSVSSLQITCVTSFAAAFEPADHMCRPHLQLPLHRVMTMWSTLPWWLPVMAKKGLSKCHTHHDLAKSLFVLLAEAWVTLQTCHQAGLLN